MSEHLLEHPPPCNEQPWICGGCGKKNQDDRSFCWNCETIRNPSSETLPTKPREYSQPQVAENQPSPADSSPSSSDLKPGANAAKFDIKIALVAGLIGAAAHSLPDILFVLTGSMTYAALGIYPSFLIPLATGALYFVIVEIKRKVIGIGTGALGGAASGGIYLLTTSALTFVLIRVTDNIPGIQIQSAPSLNLWTVLKGATVNVLLSTAGGAVCTLLANMYRVAPSLHSSVLAKQRSSTMPEDSDTGLDKGRSPFSLSIIEISLALLMGLLVWFWLRDIAMNAEPWDWSAYGSAYEPYPDWFLYSRERFLRSIWIMVIVMTISTIFLVRSLSGNIRHFSRLGNFVLAWPLVSFFPVSVLASVSILCVPIGFILTLIPAVVCYRKKENYGDLIAIPSNFIWILIAANYLLQLWELVGD